ncbi:flavodoxin [Clostridium sp. MCC353]|uniref:EFR1 family ferrodoxin n=1 Tax=Clostridium sp. MCC353 TaxID=2592646 RepID=UPI001C01E271|nr:EFR1 family ferrodoxin [Clostridium sp. MCC353]MBT9778745.1 flavodoxin [Clostridium sp. MCC353]
MILYFSGTGNSEFAARKIGNEIQDEVFNLFTKIRDRDFSDMHSEKPWVIAAPTYAWRIPRILEEWLSKTRLNGCRDIYFVMTCGGNIGNAGAYLKKLCASIDMNYMGVFEVVMPENYIALFTTPSAKEAQEIIKQAEPGISRAARLIKNRETFPQPPVGIKDRMDSGIVNTIFYPLFVHAKKFYATDRCISCGKCEKVCPLANIRMENGKPVWGKDCTHCMACICRCPKEAIEYGKHSKGLVRYTF